MATKVQHVAQHVAQRAAQAAAWRRRVAQLRQCSFRSISSSNSGLCTQRTRSRDSPSRDTHKRDTARHTCSMPSST